MNKLDTIKRDKDGYLIDFKQWDMEVATALAKEDCLLLNDDHWLVISLLQDFYKKHNKSLSIRTLLNLCKRELDNDKFSSLYLQKLFPKGAAKQANKLAGLPKPLRCI